MGSSPTRATNIFSEINMYYITYNGVVTPHPYVTREDALQELKATFGDIELNSNDVAFWPTISSRGNVKIEIKRHV